MKQSIAVPSNDVLKNRTETPQSSSVLLEVVVVVLLVRNQNPDKIIIKYSTLM